MVYCYNLWYQKLRLKQKQPLHLKLSLGNGQYAFLNQIFTHQLYVRIANENGSNLH